MANIVHVVDEPAAVDVDCYLIPLSPNGEQALSVDTSSTACGWAAYFSPTVVGLEALVLLRLAAQAGSAEASLSSGGTERVLLVREVRVRAGARADGYPSIVLREVPILRIEAAINQRNHRHRVASLVTAVRVAAVEPGEGGRYQSAPGRRPVPEPRLLTVGDPGGYRKPDTFYQHIADLYLHMAALSSRPAHEIAEANRTPVATVHRWIREAKARGLLRLPAHRGG